MAQGTFLTLSSLRSRIDLYEKRRVELREKFKAGAVTNYRSPEAKAKALKRYRDCIHRWKKIIQKKSDYNYTIRIFELDLQEYNPEASLRNKNSKREDLTNLKYMGFKYLMDKGIPSREIAEWLGKKRSDVISQGRGKIQKKFKDPTVLKKWKHFKEYMDNC